MERSNHKRKRTWTQDIMGCIMVAYGSPRKGSEIHIIIFEGVRQMSVCSGPCRCRSVWTSHDGPQYRGGSTVMQAQQGTTGFRLQFYSRFYSLEEIGIPASLPFPDSGMLIASPQLFNEPLGHGGAEVS